MIQLESFFRNYLALFFGQLTSKLFDRYLSKPQMRYNYVVLVCVKASVVPGLEELGFLAKLSVRTQLKTDEFSRAIQIIDRRINLVKDSWIEVEGYFSI